MIFKNFIQLRDELTKIADQNNCFVANLVNSNIDATGIGSFQVDGISCQMGSNGNISINVDGTTVNIPHDDIPDRLSEVLPGTSYTVADIMQSVSSTGDMYAVLSSITTKMSYSERMTLNDINQIIEKTNSGVSAMNYNMSELQDQLVAISDNDGFITNRGWLAALQTWFKACEDGADAQSPELDSTSAGTVSTLYYVLSQAASILPSIIFAALAAIFHGVWVIVSGIFTMFINLIKSTLDESVIINPNAPNNFMRGYVVSQERSSINALTQLTPDYSINYGELPSCGLFFWKGGANNTQRFNAFYQPKITPYMLGDALNALSSSDKSNMGIAWSVNYSYPLDVLTYFKKTGPCVTDSKLSLRDITPDEESQIMNDPAFYSACLCVSEFYRWICSAPYKTASSAGTAWADNMLCGYSFQNQDTHIRMAVAGFICTVLYMGSRDIFSAIGRTGYCDIVNACTSTINAANIDILSPRFVQFHDGTVNTILASNPAFVSTDSIRSELGIHATYSYYSNYNVAVYDTKWDIVSDYIKANSIPTSFGAKCAAVTSEAMLQAMALTATVSIAAAAVTSRLNKAIRRKKIKKQILRSQALNQAREQYLADPNDEQALENYVTAVDKYNRLGKLFNWGSYDAANNWFDASTSAANSQPQSHNAIRSVYTAVHDLAPLGESLTNVLADIDTVHDDVSGLTNSVGGISQSVGDVLTDVGILSNDLGGVSRQISQLYNPQSDIAEVSGDVDSVLDKVNTLLESMATVIGKLSEIKSLIR